MEICMDKKCEQLKYLWDKFEQLKPYPVPRDLTLMKFNYVLIGYMTSIKEVYADNDASDLCFKQL